MKRNMDLVRALIIAIGDAQSEVYRDELFYLWESEEELIYHLDLLHKRGLIEASTQRDVGGHEHVLKIEGLTWEGSDFLEAVRYDKLYKKALQVLKQAGGMVTIETISQASSMIVKSQLAGLIR